MGLAGVVVRKSGGPREIRRTFDFRRIEAVPRRTSYLDFSQVLTEWLKTPDGEMTLNQAQAWSLSEMAAAGGLIGNLLVGAGKSLLSYLAPVVLDSKRPLLLVPASLREKTISITIPEMGKHWRVPENLRVMSYESLSQVKQADILGRIMPDLIIADEVHRIANKRSGLSRRVLRYFDDYPETKFVGVSGSITRKSIKNYAHLIALALRQNSPLPLTYTDLEDWSGLIDDGISDDMRPEPGAFLLLCDDGESPREGFKRRLLETEGYVSTAAPSVTRMDGAEVSLSISELEVEVPQVVKDAFEKLRTGWKTPDGGEFTSGIDFAGHARELASGFFYRWIWPGNKVDHEWMEKRKNWKSFVRRTIRYSGHKSELYFRAESFKQTPGEVVATVKSGSKFNVGEIITVESFNVPKTYEVLSSTRLKTEGAYGFFELRLTEPTHSVYYDTELQVWQACAGGRLICRENEWADWEAIKDRCDPPTEAVWVSDFLIDAAVDWAKKNEKDGEHGIIWTDQKAVLHRLRERGMVCFGGGENDIMYEKGDRTVVASVNAHKEGKDLQMFHRALFTCVSPDSLVWEQALGRSHRMGQLADEVNVDVFLHCMELWKSFDTARKNAQEYVAKSHGQERRLIFADIIVSGEEQVIARAAREKLDPMWLVDYPEEATRLETRLESSSAN